MKDHDDDLDINDLELDPDYDPLVRVNNPIRDRFFTMPREMFQREDISLLAKGIFGVVMSIPQGVVVDVDMLDKMLPESREVIQESLNELAKHKYIGPNPS